MKIKFPLKEVSEKSFKEIVAEIGPYNYCCYEKGDSIPGQIYKQIPSFLQFNCVVAGTGCTIADYNVTFKSVFKEAEQPEVIVPAGSPIMIVRGFRFDDTHAEPHYNVDDQLFFPVKSGEIYRMSRDDAEDHFIRLTENSSIKTIAEAYNLPEKKSGPTAEYSVKGAKLPIVVNPLEDKEK
jgi:hypothetical protein